MKGGFSSISDIIDIVKEFWKREVQYGCYLIKKKKQEAVISATMIIYEYQKEMWILTFEDISLITY